MALTTGWIKSSHSTGEPCNCVEARLVGDVVEVRDSKDPDGPVLNVGTLAWQALIDRT